MTNQDDTGPLLLLIDDYEDTRRLFVTVLTKAGFRVATAETADEGISRAIALSPDAVVTDLSLPDLDGSEVVRRLKSMEDTRETPVIVLSAHGSLQKTRTALEAGADGFVSKMSTPRTLVREIRRLLDEADVR